MITVKSLAIFLIFFLFFVLQSSTNNNPLRANQELSLTIMCRLYHGSALEYYNVLAIGYNLFWPRSWTNSDLVLVFDDESEIDHRFAVTLANLPPYPIIKFEKKPIEKTFCTDWRSEVLLSFHYYLKFYTNPNLYRQWISNQKS